MIFFDTINTLLIIIFLFNIALLLPIIKNVKHNVQTFVYAVNIVMILIWVVTMIGFRSQTENIESWLRALYVAAIFIGVTYMQFTFYYPIKIANAKYYIYAINTLAFVTAYIVMLSDKIIVRGIKNTLGEPVIIFGSWYWLYIFIIIVPFVLGFMRHTYLLLHKKSRILYLLLGYLFSSNIAFVTNLIFPWLGIFKYNWVGQYFTIIMVSFTTYSILKFNLMNVKLAAINAGVVLLVITTFAQMLFADSAKSLLVSSLVFFISSVTGYYLIKISRSERDSLAHTILLNKKIKKINSELEDANEKLKSLDKLKSEFISLASHQLRSPLTVIKGYASTLTDGIVGDITEKQKEIVQRIYVSAQGLANVVEDFLNVTKIEQGGMKYVFVPTDIRIIVNDLVSDMRIPAELKKLEFQTDVNEGVFMVNADATKMKQVFLNLIDNSIKYTQQGFVKVWLHKMTDKDGKEMVKFGVSDSGAGVSEETKAKLFQKFSRGEGASMNGGGSGLGLYLAQEIVKAHGGEIVIDSEGLGKGSTFSVMLPLIT
jgi:signal transduction histidine kinase